VTHGKHFYKEKINCGPLPPPFRGPATFPTLSHAGCEGEREEASHQILCLRRYCRSSGCRHRCQENEGARGYGGGRPGSAPLRSQTKEGAPHRPLPPPAARLPSSELPTTTSSHLGSWTNHIGTHRTAVEPEQGGGRSPTHHPGSVPRGSGGGGKGTRSSPPDMEEEREGGAVAPEAVSLWACSRRGEGEVAEEGGNG
jgi:hypothetical protein